MREFKIGQYVYYVPRRAEGRYVVMRLLPRGAKANRSMSSEAKPNPSASTRSREASFAGFLARGEPGAYAPSQLMP
jgi:hypothetical protein